MAKMACGPCVDSVPKVPVSSGLISALHQRMARHHGNDVLLENHISEELNS